MLCLHTNKFPLSTIRLIGYVEIEAPENCAYIEEGQRLFLSTKNDGTIIQSGEIFYLTQGAYEEYFVLGVFQALEQLDIFSLQKEFVRTYKSSFVPGAREFSSWLSERSLIKEIQAQELNI